MFAMFTKFIMLFKVSLNVTLVSMAKRSLMSFSSRFPVCWRQFEWRFVAHAKNLWLPNLLILAPLLRPLSDMSASQLATLSWAWQPFLFLNVSLVDCWLNDLTLDRYRGNAWCQRTWTGQWFWPRTWLRPWPWPWHHLDGDLDCDRDSERDNYHNDEHDDARDHDMPMTKVSRWLRTATWENLCARVVSCVFHRRLCWPRARVASPSRQEIAVWGVCVVCVDASWSRSLQSQDAWPMDSGFGWMRSLSWAVGVHGLASLDGVTCVSSMFCYESCVRWEAKIRWTVTRAGSTTKPHLVAHDLPKMSGVGCAGPWCGTLSSCGLIVSARTLSWSWPWHNTVLAGDVSFVGFSRKTQPLVARSCSQRSDVWSWLEWSWSTCRGKNGGYNISVYIGPFLHTSAVWEGSVKEGERTHGRRKRKMNVKRRKKMKMKVERWRMQC